jgi:hypothetical protein
MKMMRRTLVLLTLAGLMPGLTAAAPPERSFASGYAGTLPSEPKLLARTYFDDPKVRALIYESESGPIPEARVVAALQGTSFTIDDLLRVKLLRQEGDRCFLAFNYFNAQDQALIARAAEELVPSLVQAYLAKKRDLHALLRRYPVGTVPKEELAFALLAGFSLNWDGLKITREKGYRNPVLVEGPGFKYSFWASEEIPNHDTHGFYWGSSTFPGGGYDFKEPSDFSFSSFGDPYSDPRMNFPDLFLMSTTDMEPGVREAATKLGLVEDDSFGGHFSGVIGLERGRDLAMLLFALRRSPMTASQLASQTRNPSSIDGYLLLLQETGYIARDPKGVWHLEAPVLDRQDAKMVNEVLNLSRSILAEWLDLNYAKLRGRLGDLTALRQGVPFESLFTQIWHELFGLATKQLVRSGLLLDPAGPLVRHKGSVPTLWRRALYELDLG